MLSSGDERRQESAGPKTSRKSHRKSRNGCLNCKKRRIKCNEAKPECDNCVKHSDKCSFRNPTQSLTPTSSHWDNGSYQMASPALSNANGSPGSLASPNDRVFGQNHVLNIMDLELLHNWVTSTAYTCSNISELQSFFRVNIPAFAFSRPFVLHGILAMSALHLSHFKKGEQQLIYKKEAEHHYEIAFRTATALLPTINDDTAPALYVFGQFCNIITLGLGPKPGDFLLFGHEGISEWLVIFRGLKTILETNMDLLMHGELAPLFNISINNLRYQATSDEHLLGLKDLILSSAREDPDLPIYIKALDDLGRSFPASIIPGQRTPVQGPQICFVWFYRLQDEFVECLHQRRPIPLVILAHFCVIFHDLSAYWWAKGWPEHLISEIHASLSEEYRMWMRWPMEEIGWLPG